MAPATKPAQIGQNPLEHTIEPPPFLKTWPRVYAMILSYLIVLLTALYTLTRTFHY